MECDPTDLTIENLTGKFPEYATFRSYFDDIAPRVYHTQAFIKNHKDTLRSWSKYTEIYTALQASELEAARQWLKSLDIPGTFPKFIDAVNAGKKIMNPGPKAKLKANNNGTY